MKRFGKWLVIGGQQFSIKRGRSISRSRCRCDCGVERWVLTRNLMDGRSKSCGCDVPERLSVIGLERSKPCLPSTLTIGRWNRVVKNAARRRLEFSISREDAAEMLERQGCKCALSGIPIDIGRGESRYGTASLDRVDNSKGYIPGNVQWVHKDINWLKQDYDESYFIELCVAVAKVAGATLARPPAVASGTTEAARRAGVHGQRKDG